MWKFFDWLWDVMIKVLVVILVLFLLQLISWYFQMDYTFLVVVAALYISISTYLDSTETL